MDSRSITMRLGAVDRSTCALGLVLIPALASAHGYHTFSGMAYPWQNPKRDVLIFVLGAFAIVSAIPLLIRGTTRQRLTTLGLLIVPTYTVVAFSLWILRMI